MPTLENANLQPTKIHCHLHLIVISPHLDGSHTALHISSVKSLVLGSAGRLTKTGPQNVYIICA